MTSLIDSTRVMPCLRTRDLQQTLSEMTRIAAQAALLDHNAVWTAVTARGESSSFVFGRGVMVPHAIVAGLREPVGVFARLAPGLELDAADGMRVDLALLILSGEGDEATLLRALACAARRLRDHDVAERLRSADSAHAIHVVLTSDVWRESPTMHRAEESQSSTNVSEWPTITAPS